MKVGISLNIDVMKIDKSRLVPGKNGAMYLDLTTFVDLANPDQYGNNGFITSSKKKDEPKDIKLPILGNSRVFWSEQIAPQAPKIETGGKASDLPKYDDSDDKDDIPF